MGQETEKLQQLLDAELVGNLPVVTITGTPRTMGGWLGERLRSRIQVLAHDCLSRLINLGNRVSHPGGSGAADAQRRAREVTERLAKLGERLARFEPALWMELSTLAEAAKIPVGEVLAVHAYHDLLSLLGVQDPACDSSCVMLDADSSQTGSPLVAMAWQLPPFLMSHVLLLRRLPEHGPATLTLTLAGLHAVAGVSEAGVAVVSADLRVNDGNEAGLPTSSQVTAVLSSPTFEDAVARLNASPRLGGRACLLSAGDGSRAAIEMTGSRTAVMPDPDTRAPRVHTNHILSADLHEVGWGPGDPTSRKRLAALAKASRMTDSATLNDVDGWFSPGGMAGEMATWRAPAPEDTPVPAAVLIADPGAHAVHAHKGAAPAELGRVTV